MCGFSEHFLQDVLPIKCVRFQHCSLFTAATHVPLVACFPEQFEVYKIDITECCFSADFYIVANEVT